MAENELSAAVKRWREARKISVKQLAAMVGTTRQSIENLEKGGVKRPDYVVDLAHVMGLDVNELNRGRVVFLEQSKPPAGQSAPKQDIFTPKGVTSAHGAAQELAARYLALPDTPRLTAVPLVTRPPTDPDIPFFPLPRAAWERQIHTVANVGESGFAVEIRDDAMVSGSSGPSYPPGTVIIASHALRPSSGSIVVVQVGEELLVRRFVRPDGVSVMLESLNPKYPLVPLPAGGRVVGVAVRAEIDIPA